MRLGWPEYKIGINPYALFNKINFDKEICREKINQKLNIDSNSIKILFVSEYNFHRVKSGNGNSHPTKTLIFC